MAKEKSKETETKEVISRGEKFFERHANLLMWILLGVVIVAFGIWAYVQYVHKPRLERANEALYVAEDQFIAGGDSTVLKTPGITDRGVLAIIDKYSGTKAANLSHLYAGVAYYDLGQFDKALEQLKKFNAKDDMIAPSAVRLMGDCCVQLDKLDEAVKYFEQAAQMANNEVVSPICLIKAGHVYETQKKYDKALAAYQTVRDKYYTAPEATQVEGDIARVQILAGK